MTGAATVPWRAFTDAAPELARRVRARFDVAPHHVLATLTRDGSPRVSGTEVRFGADGELKLGSMWGAVKAADLLRDGRFALHAHPTDASMRGGDAKVSGRAVPVTDATALAAFAADESGLEAPVEGETPTFHLFLLRLSSVVLTSIHPDGDRLLLEGWRPGAAPWRQERR